MNYSTKGIFFAGRYQKRGRICLLCSARQYIKGITYPVAFALHSCTRYGNDGKLIYIAKANYMEEINIQNIYAQKNSHLSTINSP